MRPPGANFSAGGATPDGAATKHTPGPWFSLPSAVSENICIYAGDAEQSAARSYGIGEAWNINGEPQNAANARLIAAAPELLEVAIAVKLLAQDAPDLDAATYAHREEALSRMARAAIAKATGQ